MAEVTLESLQEQIAKQNEVIAGLQGQLAKSNADNTPKVPTIPTEPVEHKSKKYAWNVAVFSFSGSNEEKYTAEEAATDQTIIAKILAIKGQGILRELV